MFGFVLHHRKTRKNLHNPFPEPQLALILAIRKLVLFCIIRHHLGVAFLRFSHHGDTEATENEIKTTVVSEIGTVSATSVPLWWFLHILTVGEDLCFTGLDQTLQSDHLPFTIQL